jgi:hypothetical protein
MPWTTNTVLGMFMTLFLIVGFLMRKYQSVPKNLFAIFILSLCVIIVAFVAVVYNTTSDLSLIKRPIIDLFCLPTAYLLIVFVKKQYGVIRFETIANFYIIAVIIQVLLSLFIFFSPEFRQVALGLLKQPPLGEAMINKLSDIRLIGFGAQFFSAGVIYSFVLMLIAAILKNNILSSKEMFWYICAFTLIFVLGMMTARTTLVGFLLSILVLFYTKDRASKNKWLFSRILFFISVLFVISFIIVLNLNKEVREKLSVIGNFGFDLFVNYFSRRELTNGSVVAMKNMYVFPNSLKTWSVGDGYFADPVNPEFGYYMHTDIGYSRLLFYFGIIGTLTYFLLHSGIIYFATKANERKYQMFFFAVVLLLFIVNLKGVASLSILVFPFLFVNKLRQKQ